MKNSEKYRSGTSEGEEHEIDKTNSINFVLLTREEETLS